MQPGIEPLLTIDEAAVHLRMSQRYVRRLVARGEIVHYRLGRAIRLRLQDLDAYIGAGRVDGTTERSRRGITTDDRSDIA